jgi:transcriptional regulator with XRE-family HTH domain
MGLPRAELVLAEIVRRNREQRGWTQGELARRLAVEGLHLHPTAVAKIETRVRGISLDEALALLRALDLNPATVLGVLAEIDTDVPPTLADRIARARASADLAHELVDATFQEALAVIDPP